MSLSICAFKGATAIFVRPYHFAIQVTARLEIGAHPSIKQDCDKHSAVTGIYFACYENLTIALSFEIKYHSTSAEKIQNGGQFQNGRRCVI